MKGRRIFGIIVVMAIVMTAIPAFSGTVKAESSGTIPSSFPFPDFFYPFYFLDFENISMSM